MKFYIATSISRANEHNIVRDYLLDRGFQLTYDWTTHGSVKCTTRENLRTVAENEFNGVKEADFLIVLLPGGHGTHVELGAALAYNKRVILHSMEEKYFMPCPDTCAFYHHPNCRHVVSSLNDLEPLFNEIKNINQQAAFSIS